MPDTIEPQLDELRRRARRRLIGAVVLALAAAVLVPMLLETDPKPLGEDVSVKIPPVDEGKFVSKPDEKSRAKPAEPTRRRAKAEAIRQRRDAGRRADAGCRSRAERSRRECVDRPKRVPSAPAKRRSTAPSARHDAPLPRQAAVPPTDDRLPRTARPTSAPAPRTGCCARPPGGSVQRAARRIRRRQGRERARRTGSRRPGYPAYTEPLYTARGTLWRVRVGPYPTREAAAMRRATSSRPRATTASSRAAKLRADAR